MWWVRNKQRLESEDLRPYIGWLKLYSFRGDSMVNWYLRHGNSCDKATTKRMLDHLKYILPYTPINNPDDRQFLRQQLRLGKGKNNKFQNTQRDEQHERASLICEHLSSMMFKSITFLIQQMEPSPTDWVVYRGLKKWRDRPVGENLYQVDGFMSTSEKASVAQRFGPLILKIIVPRGTRCLPVPDENNHFGEYEWLFAHGLKYQVVHPFKFVHSGVNGDRVSGDDGDKEDDDDEDEETQKDEAIVQIIHDGVSDFDTPVHTRNVDWDEIRLAIESRNEQSVRTQLEQLHYLFDFESEKIIFWAVMYDYSEVLPYICQVDLVDAWHVYEVLMGSIQDGFTPLTKQPGTLNKWIDQIHSIYPDWLTAQNFAELIKANTKFLSNCMKEQSFNVGQTLLATICPGTFFDLDNAHQLSLYFPVLLQRYFQLKSPTTIHVATKSIRLYSAMRDVFMWGCQQSFVKHVTVDIETIAEILYSDDIEYFHVLINKCPDVEKMYMRFQPPATTSKIYKWLMSRPTGQQSEHRSPKRRRIDL
eukprot:GILJ01020186.1.p1 GENE.GILJ01020186.1~~GILJ01020186.1.p1  ORF type:complete len:532 (+),score=50.30 GILJ01020186.1:1077-2672(+)